MPGIKNLDKLLKNISPKLHDDEFVFCSFKSAYYGDFASLNPIASFAEDEGLTLILLKDHADNQHIPYDVLFEQVKNVPLLVLDDMGAHSTTPWAQEKLYQVLNHEPLNDP